MTQKEFQEYWKKYDCSKLTKGTIDKRKVFTALLKMYNENRNKYDDLTTNQKKDLINVAFGDVAKHYNANTLKKEIANSENIAGQRFTTKQNERITK